MSGYHGSHRPLNGAHQARRTPLAGIVRRGPIAAGVGLALLGVGGVAYGVPGMISGNTPSTPETGDPGTSETVDKNKIVEVGRISAASMMLSGNVHGVADAHLAVAKQAATTQKAAVDAKVAKEKAAAAKAQSLAKVQADPRSAARAEVAARGWGAGEFSCLEKLWMKESGWKYNATNASSGAYGIPQSLPATKMASAGADWKVNPTTQIKWGLGYIAGRYGTPCAAWGHSQAKNWY